MSGAAITDMHLYRWLMREAFECANHRDHRGQEVLGEMASRAAGGEVRRLVAEGKLEGAPKVGPPLAMCTTCNRGKKPPGRSAPMGAYMCDRGECSGYGDEPHPSWLWPGESADEAGP